jgi:hypothetical protein
MQLPINLVRKGNENENDKKQLPNVNLVRKGNLLMRKQTQNITIQLQPPVDKAAAKPKISINGVQCTFCARAEKGQKGQGASPGRDVPSDIFVGWGRKVEKQTPVSLTPIGDFFGNIIEKICDV